MENCIFCKIAAGEIPSTKVYEDDTVLAFRDIAPQAPTHVLVVPKAHLTDTNDVTAENSAVVAHIFEVIPQIAKAEGLENGYRVVKVFLNVSKDEQRRRFLDRMELPEKHWKLSINDMKERALWKEYDAAYEDAINHTATEESPWYVLPADDKWYTRLLMREILLEVLTEMAPEYPPLDPAEAAKVPAAMAELEKPLE